MARTCDAVVIGGGIAGASAAAELAGAGADVVLLEREDQLAYHATGRSAAMYIKAYGPPSVRALTRAGEAFFEAPPEGFSEAPLLSPRGVLYVAEPGNEGELETLRAGNPGVELLSLDRALELVPALRRDAFAGAALEADAREMDVHAIHGGFVGLVRRAGGEIRTGAEVLGLRRDGDTWRVETGGEAVSTPVVVNAAGAWADVVAGLAGLGPIGIEPRRRTAVIVEGPGPDCASWPLVADLAAGQKETWYVKPEARGKLLASPADETPSPPCDARPEELDIAIVVDRLRTAFELEVRRVEHRWAGLRSFAPDGTLVIGFDPRAEGFFWLAGQGGYGIQTAPAAGRLAAALAAGEETPAWCGDFGLDIADLAPGRLLISR